MTAWTSSLTLFPGSCVAWSWSEPDNPDSQADLAVDLRRQVAAELLRAGKSEKEVVQFMTERYGTSGLPATRPDRYMLCGLDRSRLSLAGPWLARAPHRSLRQSSPASRRTRRAEKLLPARMQVHDDLFHRRHCNDRVALSFGLDPLLRAPNRQLTHQALATWIFAGPGVDLSGPKLASDEATSEAA